MAHLRQAVGVERVVQEELAVPVVEVLHHAQADLVEMALAVHPPRRLPRPLHRREQERDQYRDNNDDDQQFDQREGTAPVHTQAPGVAGHVAVAFPGAR